MKGLLQGVVVLLGVALLVGVAGAQDTYTEEQALEMQEAAVAAEGSAAAAATGAGMQNDYNEQELLCGAIYWRGECEELEATQAQINIGNAMIAAGDADTALGDPKMANGDACYAQADGWNTWAQQCLWNCHFTGAYLHFRAAMFAWDPTCNPAGPGGSPYGTSAAADYAAAETHYTAAGVDYQQALDYFEELAITLSGMGGGMGE